MKKQFLNLGKALNKAEQKEIKGGKIVNEYGDGLCFIDGFWRLFGCDVLCPDGSDPICQ